MKPWISAHWLLGKVANYFSVTWQFFFCARQTEISTMLESLRKKLRTLNKTEEHWKETKTYLQVKTDDDIHSVDDSEHHIFFVVPVHCSICGGQSVLMVNPGVTWWIHSALHKNIPFCLLPWTTSSLHIADPSSSKWRRDKGGVSEAAPVPPGGGERETEGSQTGRGNQDPGDVWEAGQHPGADHNPLLHRQWYGGHAHSEGFDLFTGTFTDIIHTTLIYLTLIS